MDYTFEFRVGLDFESLQVSEPVLNIQLLARVWI